MRVTPGDIDVHYYGRNSGITSLTVCLAISDTVYTRLQTGSDVKKLDISLTLYIDSVKDITRRDILNGFVPGTSGFRRLLQ